ncbi:MAG: BON domain-containing protein [Pseudomonadota bacterium]|nr:BON domain-containing protein [Pseudomonadota bacterium]
MINRTTSITRFVIGLLLVAYQESTGEYIDDSGITASVKAAIYNDPILKVGQISVETYKGAVQLSGFVDSRQAATRAVELARSVKGVKSVKDSLVVK